jgi:hypothetical protein
MGLFNLVENFFFISLGITFVLIMLLVFHFKQRLSALEMKNEDLVNHLKSIIELLNLGRNAGGGGSGAFAMHSQGAHPHPHPHQPPAQSFSQNNPLANSQNKITHPFSTPNTTVIKSNPEYNTKWTPTMKVIVSDDDEDDTEYETEDECESNHSSDDYYESDDLDNNSEDDYEEEEEENKKITETAIHEASPVPENMVELLLEEECLDVLDIPVSHESSTESLAHELNNSVMHITELTSLDEIVDANNETHTPEIVKEEPLATEENVSREILPKEGHLEEKDLKKMNVNELKALVISKGYTVDTSKMKKSELISFLLGQ